MRPLLLGAAALAVATGTAPSDARAALQRRYSTNSTCSLTTVGLALHGD
jgi:hypothetical protein